MTKKYVLIGLFPISTYNNPLLFKNQNQQYYLYQ